MNANQQAAKINDLAAAVRDAARRVEASERDFERSLAALKRQHAIALANYTKEDTRAAIERNRQELVALEDRSARISIDNPTGEKA
jgi:primosomal protein N''